MSSRLIEPVLAQPSRNPTACAVCGQVLRGIYYYLPDRPECYCERCMTTLPRCTSCAAPVGADGWTLHDGRVQCATCHRSAIYDVAEANRLFAKTIQALEQYPGLHLQVGAAFRLVDAPTLYRLAREGGIEAGENQHTLGLYHRQGRLRVVYVLYGLPKLLFREVIAHEYAHVWQGEHCPLLSDHDWREGSAEWVAYHHLLHLGASKAAQRLRTNDHPYRAGLDKCLALEAQVGIAGVLKALRGME
ncbi:MAG: protein DA1 [Herpetosiphonaceae bacterium]|nr:protein DA1 [Herpetosiphonaceae bacterium]